MFFVQNEMMRPLEYVEHRRTSKAVTFTVSNVEFVFDLIFRKRTKPALHSPHFQIKKTANQIQYYFYFQKVLLIFLNYN